MMRYIRRLFYFLAAVLVAAALGVVLPRPFFAAKIDAERTRSILVVANPIHTDILLPADDDVVGRFADLGDAGLPVSHPNARWLVFGWGSRAFYIETPTWSELKPGPLFKAVTLDSSVMHITVTGDFPIAQPGVTEYRLDDASFARLMAFIDASFVRDGTGHTIHIPGEAYGENDAFFEAYGSFNALVGCNTWTARALREAGLQTGWWNPLPQSLAWSLALQN